MTLANGKTKNSLAVPGIGSLAHENAQLKAQNTRLIDYQHEQAAKITQLEAEIKRKDETILAQAQRILELEARATVAGAKQYLQPEQWSDLIGTVDGDMNAPLWRAWRTANWLYLQRCLRYEELEEENAKLRAEHRTVDAPAEYSADEAAQWQPVTDEAFRAAFGLVDDDRR